jgi:hypothetical protein
VRRTTPPAGAPVLTGLVVAGQHLGDRGVPQRPLGRRPDSRPGVVASRSDLAALRGQRTADRSDPEPSLVLGDEPADPRDRGSHSRAEKLVAALKISTVRSSRRSSASSHGSHAPTRRHPSALPASIAAWRTQRRNVSSVIPNRPAHRRDRSPLRVVVLNMLGNQPDRFGLALLVVLARHRCHLPNERGVHQTRGGSGRRTAGEAAVRAHVSYRPGRRRDWRQAANPSAARSAAVDRLPSENCVVPLSFGRAPEDQARPNESLSELRPGTRRRPPFRRTASHRRVRWPMTTRPGWRGRRRCSSSSGRCPG